MQFVWTDDVLSLLLYLSILVGWNQFRADRGVDDVEQCGFCRFVVKAVGNPRNKMFYQRFGHACVDSVHRHVVAVVGGPSESKLRQVACSDYHSIALVGNVHKQLGAFTGLRVLISHVVHVYVVADVIEVLDAGIFD